MIEEKSGGLKRIILLERERERVVILTSVIWVSISDCYGWNIFEEFFFENSESDTGMTGWVALGFMFFRQIFIFFMEGKFVPLCR